MADFSNAIEVVHNGNDRVLITFGGQGLEMTIEEAEHVFLHIGYALQDLKRIKE